MRRLAVFPILVLLAAPAAAQDSALAARSVVESLHEVLIASMKGGPELGFQGRYERILANLDETFDLPFMARASLGKAWKDLSDPQRSEFMTRSRRLSAARYAHNFDGYDGQRFVTHSEHPAARGTILVKTELFQPKDRDVRFDYRLRKVGDRWRIIDILVDGQISEIVLWRGQYSSVMEREGFDGLLKALEARIAELSQE